MLPETFADIIDERGEVILEQNVIEKGDKITASQELVKQWINNPNITGKAAEYVQRWKNEGRI